MYSIPFASVAGKFVVEYNGPMRVDLNLRLAEGGTLLGGVRGNLKAAACEHCSKEKHGTKRHLLYQQQLLDFERFLVERGAIDEGWRTNQPTAHICV